MQTPLLCPQCKVNPPARPGRQFCSQRCYWESKKGKPTPIPRHRLGVGGGGVRGRKKLAGEVDRIIAGYKRNVSQRTYQCRYCQRDFTPTMANQRYCSGSCWRSRQRDKKPLAKRFVISRVDYDALLEKQQGVCAVCGSGNIHNYGKQSRLSVDHCHKSDRVRGLLCNHCNMGIGCLKDDPELLRKAAVYLETAETCIKGEYTTNTKKYL